MTQRDASIAWFAAAAHVVAAAAMLVLLREGLPPITDEERLGYIATHRAAWTFGWLTWHVAVLSLLALYSVLALRFRDAWSVTAVAIATAGAAIDLATQSRYIAILPELRGEAFAALDRDLEVQTAYAANGLYTVALILIVLAGWRELPRLALALAGPVAAAGFALALAALQHNASYEILSSAILFPLFVLWTIVVARWLRDHA